MTKPTVYAVMKVTIEVPVRCSNAEETCVQLYEVSKREAEAIIQAHLPKHFRTVGPIEFAYAVIREA